MGQLHTASFLTDQRQMRKGKLVNRGNMDSCGKNAEDVDLVSVSNSGC